MRSPTGELEQNPSHDGTQDAQARVRELEAEVGRLALEKDILKKAAAYFAREQS